MMTKDLFRLEFLPNELLIEIFQYLDARDLFQAFNNLNSRLDVLLRSLNNLCFTLLISNLDEIFSSYIHTLILNDQTTINLDDFTNLHRLKLLIPTYKQLKQFKSGHFPHLEHLSIGYQNNHFSLHMPNLHEKIFSHGFSNLISCDLFEPRLIPEIFHSTQLPSLRFLKLDAIRISTYQMILSICPSLEFLQLTAIDSPEKTCCIQQHENLKRMTIKYIDFLDVLSDGDIDRYLFFVPNLESLILHRHNADADIGKYLNYQWLSRLIEHALPVLRRFQCYFYIFQAEQLIEHDRENLLKCLENNFHRLHPRRYKSRLICRLSPLSFWRI